MVEGYTKGRRKRWGSGIPHGGPANPLNIKKNFVTNRYRHSPGWQFCTEDHKERKVAIGNGRQMSGSKSTVRSKKVVAQVSIGRESRRKRRKVTRGRRLLHRGRRGGQVREKQYS